MPAKKDWVGMTFGRWTVKAETENPRLVLCACTCGVEKEVQKCSLSTGASISCGCFRAEVVGEMKRIPVAERLWDRAKRNASGCLVWRGSKNAGGYGTIGIEGKSTLVHRVAWEETYGEIPEGLFVCHHCDNPACIEPTHLFLGTNDDNMKDMAAKKRGRSFWDTASKKEKQAKIDQVAEMGRKPKSEETKAKMSAARKAWHKRKHSGQMSR